MNIVHVDITLYWEEWNTRNRLALAKNHPLIREAKKLCERRCMKLATVKVYMKLKQRKKTTI